MLTTLITTFSLRGHPSWNMLKLTLKVMITLFPRAIGFVEDSGLRILG